MPVFTKRKTKLHLQLTNSDHASAHGGQVLIDTLCRRFGLWKALHNQPALEVRKRTGAGFSPVAIVAQLLFSFTSGGASLADAERLGADAVLMSLLGLDKGADQTTIAEWLRAQSPESVRALHRLNAAWVDWASQQAKPARWLHAGEVEVFFDDTQVEVQGYQFEGARINYEGNRALSWQTLWYGPWLLDGILDGAGDVSEHLPVLLDEHQHSLTGLSKPVLVAGASAITNGLINWMLWPLNCRRASGVRCRPPANFKSNIPGSNTNPGSAKRCRSLPRYVGSRRVI